MKWRQRLQIRQNTRNHIVDLFYLLLQDQTVLQFPQMLIQIVPQDADTRRCIVYACVLQQLETEMPQRIFLSEKPDAVALDFYLPIEHETTTLDRFAFHCFRSRSKSSATPWMRSSSG